MQISNVSRTTDLCYPNLIERSASVQSQRVLGDDSNVCNVFFYIVRGTKSQFSGSKAFTEVHTNAQLQVFSNKNLIPHLELCMDIIQDNPTSQVWTRLNRVYLFI